MKVISSGDGGATWSSPVTAITNAGWGGATAVDGGVMVLGATPHPNPNKEPQFILMQKVTMFYDFPRTENQNSKWAARGVGPQALSYRFIVRIKVNLPLDGHRPRCSNIFMIMYPSRQ